MKRNRQKIFYADTNLFIRFLTPDKNEKTLNKKVKRIFRDVDKGKFYLQTNSLVIAECTYVLERIYSFTKCQISEVLKLLFASKNIIIKDKKKVLKSLDLFCQKNIDFEDAYTYLCMIDEDIEEIFTFDKHFKRLEGITVLP